MTGVRIIPAGATMLDLLAALHAACFEEAWNRSFLARLLATPGSYALVGTLGPEAEPAGFIVCRVGGGEGEVLSIGVVPAARRHGVGRQLLRAGLAEADSLGAEKLCLEVAADNAAAIELYKRNSFQPVGVRRGYYPRPDRPPVDALVLCYDILNTNCDC